MRPDPTHLGTVEAQWARSLLIYDLFAELVFWSVVCSLRSRRRETTVCEPPHTCSRRSHAETKFARRAKSIGRTASAHATPKTPQHHMTWIAAHVILGREFFSNTF